MGKIKIKGNKNDGKSVIKQLQSLGGSNIFNYSGTNEKGHYTISSIGYIIHFPD